MSTVVTIRRFLSAAFALLLLAPPAPAKDKVKITGVGVGFPVAGRDEGVAKFGAWAPVFVSFELLGEVSEPAELLIEAPDADEIGTTLAVPVDLTGLAPGTKVFAPDRGALGYVRPAGSSAEVTVTVRTAKGALLSEPFRLRLRPREALAYVVLAVGGRPAGFELPKPSTGGEVGPLRNGRIDLGHVSTLAQLPDQWFGYDAADLVVLNTGTAAPEFLEQLFVSDAPADVRKRDALFEWVRRGGRLVVSVGANAALVARFKHLAPLLPYAVNAAGPTRTADAVALYWSAGSGGQTGIVSGALGARGGPPFPLANIVPQPGKPARVLIPPPGRSTDDPRPVAAQSAFGLGRVTVIGFDLDRAPFAEFAQRPEFWDWVLREGGANRASGGGDGKARPAGALSEEEDEAAVAIRQHNDTFDGVAVVSFGWIAVLIVLYILLIGPVEYFFLKRVLGRLELTWVTFPVIVLTVSAAAYFTADAIKGRELKVNKVDVVDIDPASNRVYGTTWFTVFSPRIDTYTVGVSPNDGWGADALAKGATVNWLGAPRGGRPGLVRRKYAIHSDGADVADGLENVPIQVWSTKAFSANWSDRLGASAVRSALVHPPGDPTKVIGTFAHDLPVPALTECVVFYAGQAYPLTGDVILRNEPVRVVLDQGTATNQWLQTKGQLDALLNRVQSYAERPGPKAGQRPAQQVAAFSGALPLWGVLFHEGALKNEEGVVPRNASLRRLDQSWRLTPDNRDEVIVVGRVAPVAGPAEDILTGPNAPAKAWLKGLPGAGERRPTPGTARQETWVRFYLPVR
ncbi:hypothetical protein [Frigoriglobus tundricola]|uniref:Glutamine amidotransferase domain-containing protein n=1 Tax=Frigoriglobus tundricola TaxID=2774151 RepID=A0A6M5YFG1_9BACT|nr:hypothetical protein [Frigoriglobus tundricola]QJW92739.1 hypothetical protein FTUN_0236 [Frigoriglobus tundricola]